MSFFDFHQFFVRLKSKLSIPVLSAKATKVCEISTLLLSVCTVDKSEVARYLANFCGLLRINEL